MSSENRNPAHGKRTAIASAIFYGTAAIAGCAADHGKGSQVGTETVGPQTSAISTPGWTATWGVAPQSNGYAFAASTTLRQTVHSSVSGSSLRLQLSNVFGTQPVTISDVHVVEPTDTSGWGVDLTTDKQVTFGGQTSVTIPAGQTIASDTVKFAVAALMNITVNLYLPQATGPSTWHQLSMQDDYWYVGGDVTGYTNFPAGWAGMWSNYFLTGIDVQNSAATGAIATLGASITDGYATANDANQRWPNDLAVRIQNAGLNVGVLNEGISGNDLLVDGSGQSALNRFSRDVANQSGVKWVVMSDDPINDIGGGNTDGASLVTGLQQIVQDAHAQGLEIICSTLTPFQGSGGWSSAGEVARGQVNSFVRGSGSGCDAILDQDTATHDPNNPAAFLAAYDSGDHLHPNAAGLQAVANAFDLSIFGSSSTSPSASCQAIHAANPSQPSGQYTIDPDGPGPVQPTSVYCDMTFDDGNGAGGWTLIESIQANQDPSSTVSGVVTPGTTTAMPLATVEALAAVSSQVHIRTPNMAGTASVTSVPNSSPIVHLRGGQILNSLSDAQEHANWTGPYATAAYLDFSCDTTGYTWPSIYWACGNNAGTTIVTSWSEWRWSANTLQAFEVYVR